MRKILVIIFVSFLFTIIVGCNDSTDNQYTITFNSNGGTEVSSITQDYNTQVTKPDDPTKAGYDFGGWYSDSDLTQEYSFTIIPKENITLYAKWIEFSTEGFEFTVAGNYSFSVSGYNGSDTNIVIPKYYKGYIVDSIGSYAFNEATSLTSITIPNSVTKIGSYAFNEATSLTSITIPNSVKTIGDYAFSEATSLTSITIPNSVERIGHNAFSMAENLTSINVDIDNSQYSSKDGVLFNKNQTLIIKYPEGKKEDTYVIPDSVTIIGLYSFSIATSLKSITIPNSVIKIDHGTFAFVESLSTVIFEKNSQLITIRDLAFLGTKNLTSIILTATTPPSIDGLCVYKDKLKIYVPSDYVSLYKTEWKSYASIIYPISES
ncbi:leucine-rich repeat protein [Mycoplasmatota bacterium]|nr:leucine-rich repeat protein [Mycoplasmatota bacterium]